MRVRPRNAGSAGTKPPLFGVGLLLRTRFFESLQLQAGGIRRDNFWKFFEWHFQTPCIRDLRDEADVRERHLVTT